MDWTPNKWIAAVLGFFLQPLGMLYVVKVKWAFIYFGIGALIALIEFSGLYKSYLPWLENFSLNWILMCVCAIHAYRVAIQYTSNINRPWYSHWYGLVSIPAILFVGIFCFRAFMFEPFLMPARSMFPSIEPGSTLVAKKAGYGNYGTYGILLLKMQVSSPVHRGDIVIFEYPKVPSINYVKRIIGLPGDIIEYRKKHLLLNGEQIHVKRLQETLEYEIWEEKLDTTTYAVANAKGRPANNFTFSIPEGQYFVLGDNRDNSNDSRYWGFVPEENLVGKVIYVFH